jgi:hypothetical protein
MRYVLWLKTGQTTDAVATSRQWKNHPTGKDAGEVAAAYDGRRG